MNQSFTYLCLSLTLFLSFSSPSPVRSQEAATGTMDYVSHEMSGNKLFVHTETHTYSFAPYGDEILRAGLHFGQDTLYPASLSVIMAPAGEATLEESANFLTYSTSDYRVVVQKIPLSFAVLSGEDTLLRSGEAHGISAGSRMQFLANPGSAWYGGGSRAIPMNRAGLDLVMYNQPFYGYGWGRERLNISIPVVISDRGFGLYFENPSPGLLSLGSAQPDLVSYEAASGPLSCFIFHPQDPRNIMEPYTALTGRQPLPPLWALGYIQSRFGYENETEATNMVNQMVGQGFPLDAIVFDLQWQGGVGEMGNFKWDTGRFPDPEAMMQEFRDLGVKSVCIADPYFTQECQYFGMLSGIGWFAKTPGGAPYILDNFWAGRAGLIDITDPAAANWFWQRCKALIDGGVEGLWTDLGEPELAPDDMVFYSGEAVDVRQTYNLQWAGGIFGHFSEDFPDRRLFNLTRSGYAGMQRYSTFPWSGDVQKSFGGMYSQVPVMLGMGLSGFGYMGADIGGFTGEFNPELYTRWQQMGAFIPVMRAHGVSVATEPIHYPEPYKGIVKKFITLRYQFLPYNYTLAHTNSLSGMPPARPLFFEDPALDWVDDEYFWGDDLLVAPVMEQEAVSRQVAFPPGRWIGFFDLIAYEGGSIRQVPAPLEVLPLFVRAGALVPLIEPVRHTGLYDGSGYLVRYFADPQVAGSQARIYMDDGLSQRAVAEGEFSIIHLTAALNEENAYIEMERQGTGFQGEPLQKQMVIEVPRVRTTPGTIFYNYASIPLTDDREEYEALDESAFFDPEDVPGPLFVKIQWQSVSPGIIEINGLELSPDISIEEAARPVVQVFPNPVTTASRISMGASRPGTYDLALQNGLGQQVGWRTVFLDPKENVGLDFYETFPGDLGAGLYVLKISAPDGVSASIKVMVAD